MTFSNSEAGITIPWATQKTSKVVGIQQSTLSCPSFDSVWNNSFAKSKPHQLNKQKNCLCIWFSYWQFWNKRTLLTLFFMPVPSWSQRGCCVTVSLMGYCWSLLRSDASVAGWPLDVVWRTSFRVVNIHSWIEQFMKHKCWGRTMWQIQPLLDHITFEENNSPLKIKEKN